MTKTLFERLKPEIKENLLNSKDKYPTICNSLITILKNKVGVTDMKFGDLNHLSDFSPTRVNTVLDFYNMFEDI